MLFAISKKNLYIVYCIRTTFLINLVKWQVLRRWRNRWNASARVTPLECKQITKCIEIGLLCLKDDPFDRPSIWEIIEDVRKMECSDGHVISDEKSIVGQVNSMIFKCFL